MVCRDNSWVLLGVSLCSYRVQELLICWVFFSAMLAVLGLLIASGILAWYGGKCVFHWAGPLVQVAAPVLRDLGELDSSQSRAGRKWK
jgi:hypothetical protein